MKGPNRDKFPNCYDNGMYFLPPLDHDEEGAILKVMGYPCTTSPTRKEEKIQMQQQQQRGEPNTGLNNTHLTLTIVMIMEVILIMRNTNNCNSDYNIIILVKT